ncbi:conjugal transfer protein TrbD [Bartonella sp. DGB2]|uniref:conjugal transfer protein TrbD n=1 Tax=Bartonella sp. DGB2 TaxID=3388426 RepID=UPI00398FBD36
MALEKTPIHKAGNRPNLFMGGDRELVMLSAVLAGTLVFSAQELKATIFGVLLWFVSLYICRLMAKSDPQLRYVYLRHRQYEKYYPARSTPFRNNTPKQVKRYK